jgi:NADH dehydrogenase FAD-containing subunit
MAAVRKPQAPKFIVILGAGFGGLTVACKLDQYLEMHPSDEYEVLIIDKEYAHTIGTANNFVLMGRSEPEEVCIAPLTLTFTLTFTLTLSPSLSLPPLLPT